MTELGEMTVYARVSTEDQNVQQQAEHVIKHFTGLGWKIKRVITDTESGTTPLLNRVEFKKLLSEVSTNQAGQAVGIFKLDRITRNWDDEAPIEKVFQANWSNCRLISSGDSIDLSSATGRFSFRILMAVACLMPEDMREKQVIGIARAKAEGKYKGGKKGRRWAKVD